MRIVVPVSDKVFQEIEEIFCNSLLLTIDENLSMHGIQNIVISVRNGIRFTFIREIDQALRGMKTKMTNKQIIEEIKKLTEDTLDEMRDDFWKEQIAKYVKSTTKEIIDRYSHKPETKE